MQYITKQRFCWHVVYEVLINALVHYGLYFPSTAPRVVDHLLPIAGAALPWDLLDEMTAHLPGTSRRHTAFLKAMVGVDLWRSVTQRPPLHGYRHSEQREWKRLLARSQTLEAVDQKSP